MGTTKQQESEIYLKVPGKTTYLELIRIFVEKVAENVGFNAEEINNIAIAVDEACTNVMKHAYGNKEGERIDLVLNVDQQKFKISILDYGKSFEPEEVPLPEMDEYIAELRVGGLGIYLMKTLMDEVNYEAEPGVHNRVTMVKYINGDDEETATAS